jgi:toxin ParE1/3/4
MTKKIIITPKASQDLDDCFAYISQDRPEVALQFFDSTRLTIAQSQNAWNWQCFCYQ